MKSIILSFALVALFFGAFAQSSNNDLPPSQRVQLMVTQEPGATTVVPAASSINTDLPPSQRVQLMVTQEPGATTTVPAASGVDTNLPPSQRVQLMVAPVETPAVVTPATTPVKPVDVKRETPGNTPVQTPGNATGADVKTVPQN